MKYLVPAADIDALAEGYGIGATVLPLPPRPAPVDHDDELTALRNVNAILSRRLVSAEDALQEMHDIANDQAETVDPPWAWAWAGFAVGLAVGLGWAAWAWSWSVRP